MTNAIPNRSMYANERIPAHVPVGQNPDNAQRALAHYTQFANALGLGRQKDFDNSANFNNIGGAANRPQGGGIGTRQVAGN